MPLPQVSAPSAASWWDQPCFTQTELETSSGCLIPSTALAARCPPRAHPGGPGRIPCSCRLLVLPTSDNSHPGQASAGAQHRGAGRECWGGAGRTPVPRCRPVLIPRPPRRDGCCGPPCAAQALARASTPVPALGSTSALPATCPCCGAWLGTQWAESPTGSPARAGL